MDCPFMTRRSPIPGMSRGVGQRSWKGPLRAEASWWAQHSDWRHTSSKIFQFFKGSQKSRFYVLSPEL